MNYHKNVASQIIEYLKDGQVRRASEIQQGVTASRSGFNQALQKLLKNKQIENVGYGKYRIPSKDGNPPAVDTEPVDKQPPARKDDKDDNGLDSEPVVVTRNEPRKDEQTERAVANPDGSKDEQTAGVDKPPAKVDNDPYRFVFYPAIKIL